MMVEFTVLVFGILSLPPSMYASLEDDNLDEYSNPGVYGKTNLENGLFHIDFGPTVRSSTRRLNFSTLVHCTGN